MEAICVIAQDKGYICGTPFHRPMEAWETADLEFRISNLPAIIWYNGCFVDRRVSRLWQMLVSGVAELT